MSVSSFSGGAMQPIMQPLVDGLTDNDVAPPSALSIGDWSNGDPSGSFSSAMMSHLQPIGTAPVEYAAEINKYMAPLLAGGPMSFVNAGDQSSMEALNDIEQTNHVIATRWNDGSECSLSAGVPLFTYSANSQVNQPGWAILASPVKVNDVQLTLAGLERAAVFHGFTPEVDDIRRLRQRGSNGAAVSPSSLNSQNTVDPDTLAFYRHYGALSVPGLFKKLTYIGPIKDVHSRDNGSHSADWRQANTFGETYVTYLFGVRGYIHNMFAAKPQMGEQFYFSLGLYDTDDLLRHGSQSPFAFDASYNYRKRGWDESTSSSSYITTPERNASDGSGAVVQLRGWSSRSGHQWLTKTSPVETMKPDLADRFYEVRERRAAVEWVQFDFSSAEPKVVPDGEGLQEQVHNLPSNVIENYLDSTAIYPVGFVKKEHNRDTTTAAIHNAHYSMSALVTQPLVELFLPC